MGFVWTERFKLAQQGSREGMSDALMRLLRSKEARPAKTHLASFTKGWLSTHFAFRMMGFICSICSAQIFEFSPISSEMKA